MASNEQLRTAVITGANAGLGWETAQQLAGAGWHVVLVCRSAERGEDAKRRLLRQHAAASCEVLGGVDIGELASVRTVARALAQGRRPPLRALICNAGVQVITGLTRTSAGLETTFATNHLGHLLLARLLLPHLAPDARVVFVASDTHDPKRFTGMPAPNLDDVKAVSTGAAFEAESPGAAGRRRYTTSKLCNVMTAYELDRRVRQASAPGAAAVTVNAFDPGLMPGTQLVREYGPVVRALWHAVLPVATWVVPNMNAIPRSAARLVRMVDDAAYAGVSGKYVTRGRALPSSDTSYDEAKARELWNLSCELAGLSPTLSPAELPAGDRSLQVAR